MNIEESEALEKCARALDPQSQKRNQASTANSEPHPGGSVPMNANRRFALSVINAFLAELGGCLLVLFSENLVLQLWGAFVVFLGFFILTIAHKKWMESIENAT